MLLWQLICVIIFVEVCICKAKKKRSYPHLYVANTTSGMDFQMDEYSVRAKEVSFRSADAENGARYNPVSFGK
mgnify:FL=1